MSSKSTLQPVRGTTDILPGAMRRHLAVIDTARAAAWRYGFLEMATPVFEFDDVFRRTIGETSDIVTKEMYSFEDRNGEKITLRPENTAGVARAFISGGLAQEVPLKYFYQGPMFRYERPQKGRQRQFHQVGVELIGVATPQADVEVIALGQDNPDIYVEYALDRDVAFAFNNTSMMGEPVPTNPGDSYNYGNLALAGNDESNALGDTLFVDFWGTGQDNSVQFAQPNLFELGEG